MTMRMPDISHGNENRAIINLQPEISEQLELASRMAAFVTRARKIDAVPDLRSRSLKDYRVAQPGRDSASVAVEFSEEKNARFAAEVHTKHSPSGINSHYTLTGDGQHWVQMRNMSSAMQQPELSQIDNDDMLREMLEYAPVDGELDQLLDRAVSARGIVRAMFSDMSRSAHHKVGNDAYRAVLTTLTGDGYVSSRHMEVMDTRVNKRVMRRLSVTALVSLDPDAPQDIFQTLAYEVQYNGRGEIEQDAVTLEQSSKDGLSNQALESYAKSSDVVQHPFDLLHSTLDEIERSTLIR
jgi:hypothetical protein